MGLAIKEVAVGQKATDNADGIAQLVTSKDDLKRYMMKWDNTFEHFGLRLNPQETGSSGSKQITLDSQHRF